MARATKTMVTPLCREVARERGRGANGFFMT
jgi:hypothetical protein